MAKIGMARKSLKIDPLAVAKLDQAVEQASESNPLASRLRTHPGVGPITSLAFVLIIGPVNRFQNSKQVVSYLGLNPQEHSSGGKQRLGSISKQGNPRMRSLLVEAGHTAARFDPQLKRVYQLTEIVARNVCPEFEIAPQEALADAEEFVRELAMHGILHVSDQPIAVGAP